MTFVSPQVETFGNGINPAHIGREGMVDETVGEWDEFCFPTDDPKLIEQARKLTAAEYLRRGFITPEEVGEDGIMTAEADPDAHHSTYYVAVTPDRQQVVATVRTIGYDDSLGKNSFPLLRHHEAELDAQFVEKIGAHDHKNVTEVSALVRDRQLDTSGTAAMKLYKKLFLDIWSKDKDGNSLLIMACNPELYKNFSLLFDGEMKKIGPDLDYPGQIAVPAMFSNREGAMGVIRISNDPKNPYSEVYRNVVNYFLSGSKAEELHPDIINALEENGYTGLLEKMHSGDWGDLSYLDEQIRPAIKSAKIRGVFKKFWPEIGANILLAGYTGVRTVGVAKGVDPVSDTHWQTFLAIELGTQFPYTMGIRDLIRAGQKESYSRGRRVLASTAVASAFVAPYAYIAAEGGAENLQSAGVSAGLLALGAYFLSGKVRSVREAFRSRQSDSDK